MIGVDLSSIKPFEGIQFLQGDVTKTETLEQIKNMMNGKNADVILSDMSPDISGNYSIDQARSAWLCECALLAVTQIFRPGGHFICKNVKAKIRKHSSKR